MVSTDAVSALTSAPLSLPLPSMRLRTSTLRPKSTISVATERKWPKALRVERHVRHISSIPRAFVWCGQSTISKSISGWNDSVSEKSPRAQPS